MTASPEKEIYGDFERLPEPPVGSGATGHVYKARQLSVERVVALKVVDRRPRDPKNLAAASSRFTRETKALASFRHPNIVTIYATGLKDGIPWAAMEYLEGGTLEEEIARRVEARRGFSDAEIAKLGLAAAGALAAAHKEGIIHRDLKPTNILFDREGRAVVTDFGTAKFMDDDEGAQKVTATGDVLGTPEFMAPEQIFPAPGHTIDHRADIYALGAVLYTMSALHPPFSGRSVYDVMHKQLNIEAKPFRKAHPEHGAELEALILRCLAKRPEDRPTYDELARELGAIQSRSSDLPVPRATPPAPMKKGRLLPAAVGILILVTFATAYFWPRRTPMAKGADGGDTVPHEARPESKESQDSKGAAVPSGSQEARDSGARGPESSRKDETPEKLPLLQRIRAYRPTPEELSLLGDLVDLVGKHRGDLVRRSYDGLLEKLESFGREKVGEATKDIPEDLENYTARHWGAIRDLVREARSLVAARWKKILTDKDELRLQLADGRSVSGKVLEGDNDFIRLRDPDGKESVIHPVQLAAGEFLTGGVPPYAAFAFRSLSVESPRALAEVLETTEALGERLFTLPVLARLARLDLEERVQAALEKSKEAPEVQEVLAATEAFLGQAPVATTLYPVAAEFDRMRLEREALKAFLDRRFSHVLAAYEGTRAHPVAAETVLRSFESDLATASEELMAGIAAVDFGWKLHPPEPDEKKRRAYLDRIAARDVVILADPAGPRHLIPDESLPDAAQGILVRFGFVRHSEAKVPPEWRFSLAGPGTGSLYLRWDERSIGLYRPAFAPGQPDERIRGARLPDETPGAEFRTLSLIPGEGGFLHVCVDRVLALNVAPEEARLPKRLALTVLGSRLTLKNIQVQLLSTAKKNDPK